MVPQLSREYVKICAVLSLDTALEYYEVLIESLMERTGTFSKRLQAQGRMLESSEEPHQFIGLCLNTKQEIISNLYIVDSPDETWYSRGLSRMHQDLKQMMEVEFRFRALDYKIRIIQESVEVIVGTSPRATRDAA